MSKYDLVCAKKVQENALVWKKLVGYIWPYMLDELIEVRIGGKHKNAADKSPSGHDIPQGSEKDEDWFGVPLLLPTLPGDLGDDEAETSRTAEHDISGLLPHGPDCGDIESNVDDVSVLVTQLRGMTKEQKRDLLAEIRVIKNNCIDWSRMRPSLTTRMVMKRHSGSKIHQKPPTLRLSAEYHGVTRESANTLTISTVLPPATHTTTHVHVIL